jgi:hypothetical protein
VYIYKNVLNLVKYEAFTLFLFEQPRRYIIPDHVSHKNNFHVVLSWFVPMYHTKCFQHVNYDIIDIPLLTEFTLSYVKNKSCFFTKFD